MCQTLNQAGLAAALKQHHDAAWTWAMVCCRQDRDAAHDVLHEVYLKILQERARFLGRSTFKTWLFGVIRVSSQAARRKRFRLGLILEPISDHPNLAAVACEPNVLGTSGRLQRAMLALPTRQRQVATLVFEHDLTVEEAGAVLGISLGACRRHYARAKTKLQACVPHREAGDE